MRSKFSSNKINLRNQVTKYDAILPVTNLKIKLLLSNFRVLNSKLKNKKFYLDFLTRV